MRGAQTSLGREAFVFPLAAAFKHVAFGISLLVFLAIGFCLQLRRFREHITRLSAGFSGSSFGAGLLPQAKTGILLAGVSTRAQLLINMGCLQHIGLAVFLAQNRHAFAGRYFSAQFRLVAKTNRGVSRRQGRFAAHIAFVNAGHADLAFLTRVVANFEGDPTAIGELRVGLAVGLVFDDDESGIEINIARSNRFAEKQRA